MLSRVAFLKDLPDLDRYERRVAWRRYEEGEVVVDFEDPSTDVYFIVQGEVRALLRARSGREIILGELRAGAFFGELSAIDGEPRSANVGALTRCELCVVPGSVFRELVLGSPTLSERLLLVLVSRVRELNARLAEHSIYDLKHRLYAELLRLSSPRVGHRGERAVSPPPYHHVLAARIGCRREQVTRELSTLAAEGLVERTRGALVLHRPEVLSARLEEALQDAE